MNVRNQKFPFEKERKHNLIGLSDQSQPRMMNPQLPVEIARLEKECGGLKHKEIADAVECFLVDPEDVQLGEILLEDVRTRIVRDLVEPDGFRSTSPGPAQNVDGQIRLGMTGEGVVGIDLDRLSTSVLICGRSGGGKSNLILACCAQILEIERKRRTKCSKSMTGKRITRS
jgi:hypothetical protein